MDKTSDGWDWPWLWFISQYKFKFTEKEFWNLTPRQLTTFANEYTKYEDDVNSTDSSSQGVRKSEPKAVYIDQILG